MKFALPVVLRTLLLAASASASVAQVYLSNPRNPAQSQPTSISPDTARLIFAQRLDVAKYHTIGNADADSIKAVNDFGGRPTKLFEKDEETDRIRLLVVVEGIDKSEDIVPQQAARSSLSIVNPPDSTSNDRLLSDFQFQAVASVSKHSRVSDEEIYNFWKSTPLGASSYVNSLSTARTRAIAHLTHLEGIAKQNGDSSSQYKTAILTVQTTITQLLEKAASDNWDLVVVVMPTSTSTSLFKRSNPSSSWGTYRMPSKRQFDAAMEAELSSSRPDILLDDFENTETNTEPISQRPHIVENPADDEEVIADVALDVTSNEPSQTSSHSMFASVEELLDEIIDEIAHQSSEVSTPITTFQQQNTTPPLGILPACYSTMDDCIRTTHNCSGHGQCFLKYKDRSASGRSEGACYACGCKASRYELDEGGSQVTYWAGPACQKKDISTEFWLLGGTVLGLLGAITWGVGLLYSMGSQELPSVLGAGVAGPKAK